MVEVKPWWWTHVEEEAVYLMVDRKQRAGRDWGPGVTFKTVLQLRPTS
jgi:hypothetical protein